MAIPFQSDSVRSLLWLANRVKVMFKTVKKRVWAFDAEWIPDPVAGRLLYDLPDEAPDSDVLRHMWREGGATDEDPTPYLKTVVCRIVSVAAVERLVSGANTKLHLLSLPHDLSDPEQVSEKGIVSTFLDKVGQYRPQLVGFNSASADLKAFIQRAIVLGIQAKGFCTRPNKPWEGDDYFDSRNSEASIDIKDVIGGLIPIGSYSPKFGCGGIVNFSSEHQMDRISE